MTSRSLSGWLEFAERIHPRQIDMTLDRVRAVAARMGLLDTSSTRYIIVAGTNGKGSTTVALEALLLAQGHSVGATLSPHVHVFNERVRLNGQEVSDQTLCDAFAAVDLARGDITLTYFEFAALVALETFRRHQVEFAILEIGLGGRLDAFNIIDAEAAVVTSIGLDHQAFLGDDVEQIGREKAGVFRPGQRVVLGAVTDSVRAVAADLQCRVAAAGTDFFVLEETANWSYRGSDVTFAGLPQGALAAANWALAITVVAAMSPLTAAQVETALRTARLPGRMELWNLEGRRVLLDVAHNPAAAEFLARRLRLLGADVWSIGILGMLRDKDPPGVVEPLEAMIGRWILVPTGGERGMQNTELQQKLTQLSPASTADGIGDAFRMAISLTQQGDAILALGSFSVVEQSRNWLQQTREFAVSRQESF